MSAARSRHELDRGRLDLAYRRPDLARLRARRRQARRRRRLARLDVAIGVGAALALFVLSPGLAITGLTGVLLLFACAVSVVLERRHANGKPLLRRAPRAQRSYPATRSRAARQRSRR